MTHGYSAVFILNTKKQVTITKAFSVENILCLSSQKRQTKLHERMHVKLKTQLLLQLLPNTLNMSWLLVMGLQGLQRVICKREDIQ